MFVNKPHFAPDPDNGNGGGTPPPTTPPTTPPAGADPAEAEVAELEGLLDKDETTLTDVEKTRFTELKGKYDIAPTGTDGKPLTPEQVAAAKEVKVKVSAILAKAEDQRTAEEVKYLTDNTEADPTDPTNVYQRVNELREFADDFEIDYKGYDPLSPEGIVEREVALEKFAIQGWENEIASKFPRGYQFLMHLSTGGKEEDFFKPENQDFKSIKLETTDKKGQETVLRNALRAKGITPAIIEVSITGLKDGGNLYEAAKAELEALQVIQTQQEEQRARQVQALKAKEDADINAFYDAAEASIKKGFDNVSIPVAEQASFMKFLGNQIDYHNGKLYKVKELNQKELAKELKVAYFEFKGGDLKGLVERKAKSEQALRIKGAIKHSIKPKSNAGGSGYLPLSQL
jgi:hypothetical protein